MLPNTNVAKMTSPTVHELPAIQRPLLFTYRRCPYAMRARMALLQAGIDFDAHEISLRDKPLEMLRISPKGTVPVLVLPDQSVVDQSLDIMGWAFQGGDPGGWWGRAQSDLCLELVGLNDGPFKQHLDGYKYPERDPLHPQPQVHRDRAVACLLQPLDKLLCKQQFLGGSEAGGPIFASHFGKWRGFSDAVSPVLQGHAHEKILCRHACAGGHDEGISDRNIDRPDLNALYDVGVHVGSSWLQGGCSSVAIILPGERGIGVTPHFPEPFLVVIREGNFLDPFGAFPGISFRDNHAHRTTVVLRERPTVPFIGEQHVIVQTGAQR